MRKVIVTFLCLLPIFAYAANMCVKDGTMVVVLDPIPTGTTLSNDTDAGTWSIQFDYGVVSGVAHCGTAFSSVTVADTVVAGRGCYCKMLHPAESRWIGVASITNCSVTACTTQCTRVLTGSVANWSLPARQAMYSNAGI